MKTVSCLVFLVYYKALSKEILNVKRLKGGAARHELYGKGRNLFLFDHINKYM